MLQVSIMQDGGTADACRCGGYVGRYLAGAGWVAVAVPRCGQAASSPDGIHVHSPPQSDIRHKRRPLFLMGAMNCVLLQCPPRLLTWYLCWTCTHSKCHGKSTHLIIPLRCLSVLALLPQIDSMICSAPAHCKPLRLDPEDSSKSTTTF